MQAVKSTCGGLIKEDDGGACNEGHSHTQPPLHTTTALTSGFPVWYRIYTQRLALHALY